MLPLCRLLALISYQSCAHVSSLRLRSVLSNIPDPFVPLYILYPFFSPSPTHRCEMTVALVSAVTLSLTVLSQVVHQQGIPPAVPESLLTQCPYCYSVVQTSHSAMQMHLRDAPINCDSIRLLSGVEASVTHKLQRVHLGVLLLTASRSTVFTCYNSVVLYRLRVSLINCNS